MSNPRPRTRSPSASCSAALQRGQACITCRRKKMRCDGQRPFCGQCSLTRNPEHCEYTDRQGRTQTEILEERLSQLKLRIQELENPANKSSPIYLHHPYQGAPTAVAPSAGTAQHGASGTLSRQSSVGQASGLVMGSLGATLRHGQAPLAPGSVQTQTRVWAGSEEAQLFLSDEIFPTLLDIFFSHSSRLGFSLHIPRFRQRLSPGTSSAPLSIRPHDALLSTIALWAVCLSHSNWTGVGVTDVEQHILTYALQCVPAALASASASAAGGNSMGRVDFIQAEVLLALYFYCEGRMLEGRYHASAAMSAAVSWKMHEDVATHSSHRVRSSRPGTIGVGASMAGLALTANEPDRQGPRDALELGERINVFWSAYVLDRCWSVAMDSPPVVMYEGAGDGGKGLIITTPLPRSLEYYEKQNVQDILQNTHEHPLGYFLSEQVDYSHLGIMHLPSLRVVAAALFGNATGLVSKNVDHPAGDRDLISRAASIERTIIRLTDKLSSIAAELDRQVNGANVALKKRELAVVRCIAFAAMIQLHNRFVSGDGTSTSKTPAESTVSKRSAGMCLQAAHKVASAAENITTDEVEFLDTVVGVAWLTASRILIRERRNVGSHQVTSSHKAGKGKEAGAPTTVPEHQAQLNRLLGLMAKLGETCPVMALQAATIEDLQ